MDETRPLNEWPSATRFYMSDASGRTLLNLWGIKGKPLTDSPMPESVPESTEPVKNILPRDRLTDEALHETPSDLPQTDKSAERAKAASQWHSIFAKPKNGALQEPQIPAQPCETPTPTSENATRRARRPLDPRNPFEPSFVHTLRAPPERLREIQAQRSSAAGEAGDKAPVRADATEKPSFIHTLRAPPEKLHSIKPRVHSFFAKRPTSSTSGTGKSSRKKSSLRPIKLKHAPWSTIHVRPELLYDTTYLDPLPRRKPGPPPRHGEFRQEWSEVVAPPPHASPQSQLHVPKRALYSSEQLRALAALSKSRQTGDSIAHLITAAGMPKPFDRGEFEEAMWCEKYAPQEPCHHLLPVETQKIADWAAAQMQKRQKQRQWPPKRKRRNIDDFVVEDDEENGDDPDDILLVCGPCGSGKTSAVYAAAKAVDAFVYEVNCSSKRTGKELSNMLKGISHNHAVHDAKSCIILIDDGDIIYENEAGGFWSTLTRFTATSRRPVIVTCTDPRRIALADLGTSVVRLPMPDLVRVTDTAWTVALSEGYVMSKSDVATLAVMSRGDLRRILTHIQFWCQMGIGGLSSGVDWYAKDYEFEEHSAKRVISENTWCPSLERAFESESAQVSPPVPEDFDGLDSSATSAEVFSKLDAAFEPYQIESVTVPEETVSGNGSFVLSHWRVPIMHRTFPRPGFDEGPKSYLSAIRDIFADEYSCGTTRDTLIAEDIAPYMREIAACDFRRALIMERSLAENSSARGMRMTRRMWAASGIDSRQYMGYSVSSLRLILSTCLPAQLFEPGSS